MCFDGFRKFQIGLLRNGKILAEGNPNDLLEEFNCDNIENLFILLSTRQEEGNLHLCSQNYNVISAHKETRVSTEHRMFCLVNNYAPKK